MTVTRFPQTSHQHLLDHEKSHEARRFPPVLWGSLGQTSRSPYLIVFVCWPLNRHLKSTQAQNRFSKDRVQDFFWGEKILRIQYNHHKRKKRTVFAAVYSVFCLQIPPDPPLDLKKNERVAERLWDLARLVVSIGRWERQLPTYLLMVQKSG